MKFIAVLFLLMSNLAVSKTVRCGGFMDVPTPYAKVQLKLDYTVSPENFVNGHVKFLNLKTREYLTFHCNQRIDPKRSEFLCRSRDPNVKKYLWVLKDILRLMGPARPDEVAQLFCLKSWVDDIIRSGEWELD
jgi:hypothetical protein